MLGYWFQMAQSTLCHTSMRLRVHRRSAIVDPPVFNRLCLAMKVHTFEQRQSDHRRVAQASAQLPKPDTRRTACGSCAFVVPVQARDHKPQHVRFVLPVMHSRLWFVVCGLGYVVFKTHGGRMGGLHSLTCYFHHPIQLLSALHAAYSHFSNT